eukprot:scaffold36591_cov40-Cyclotella_meneghiniana.AAC.1
MYFIASAVEAALSSSPAGPRTSISSKQSGEDKVVQSIQGHKDHSNTVAKSSMSTDTETSTKKISAGGNVDELGDSKSSNKEEAATTATEVAGKGHHCCGESIEMNVTEVTGDGESLESIWCYNKQVEDKSGGKDDSCVDPKDFEATDDTKVSGYPSEVALDDGDDVAEETKTAAMVGEVVTEERESVAVLHTINSKSKGKVASAVEAALSSPPAGPRTSIYSKHSGEDKKLVQTIQGRKDLSNTISKSSMSTDTETSTKKISAGDSVDGLGDSKSSNKEEAATGMEGGGGKGPHHGGESIEMNVAKTVMGLTNGGGVSVKLVDNSSNRLRPKMKHAIGPFGRLGRRTLNLLTFLTIGAVHPSIMAGRLKASNHLIPTDRALQTSCYPTASKIRIFPSNGNILNMFEFIATDPTNFDLTNGKTASQSTTFNDNDVKYGAANAVDRDANTFSHTKSSDPNPVWSVDLGGSSEIAIVSITNRFCGGVTDTNNCLGRLSGATVELLDSGDNLCPTVAKIKLEALPGQQIHLFELKAISSDVNVAIDGIATQSSTYKNNEAKFGPNNAIDDVIGTFQHTNDANAWLE